MTYDNGCSVCSHGWEMTPLNWGKSGYARRLLCEQHIDEVRAAERQDYAEKRKTPDYHPTSKERAIPLRAPRRYKPIGD